MVGLFHEYQSSNDTSSNQLIRFIVCRDRGSVCSGRIIV